MECCGNLKDCSSCKKVICENHYFDCKQCQKTKCLECAKPKQCYGCYNSRYCSDCTVKSCSTCQRFPCCSEISECSRCKKPNCKKVCLKECKKCQKQICISSCSKSCSSCSSRYCLDCQSKKCHNCGRLECCGELKECSDCKKTACQSCFKSCMKCKSEKCLACTKRCHYLNNYHSCEQISCSKCYDELKCSDIDCRSFECLNGPNFQSCHHCSKKFCSRGLRKCDGCKQSFCKNVKLENHKMNVYCKDCLKGSQDIDLKLIGLLNILMDKDFKSALFNSELSIIPLLKIKEITIIYPTNLMNNQDIKLVKNYLNDKSEIKISKGFQTLVETQVKEKLNESLYPEISSLRLNFEKMIILEKGESMNEKGKQISDKHIGNIIFSLPSDFKGGEIKIHIPSKIESFQFTLKEDLSSSWVAFAPNFDYNITTIESGNLFLLIYNVFNEGLTNYSLPKLDLLNQAKKMLDDLFNNEEVKKKGKIGFALQNYYEKIDKNSLKGKDLLIFTLLESLNEYKIRLSEVKVKSSSFVNNRYYDSSDEDEEEYYSNNECNCPDCRINRMYGRDGIHKGTYTIESDNVPLINRENLKFSTIFKGKKPDDYEASMDFGRKSIFNYGMIEIMKRKRKRIDDDSDDEIKVLETPKEKSLKCPISKCTMDEPVKSKICGHSYDKSSILSYLEGKSKVCPLSGCNKQVTIDVLENDLELIEMLKNKPESEEEEEEEEEKQIKKEEIIPSTPQNTPKKRKAIETVNGQEVIVIDD